MWISNLNVCYLCTEQRMRLCVASHQSAVNKDRESDWIGFKEVGPTYVLFSFKSKWGIEFVKPYLVSKKNSTVPVILNIRTYT